MIWPMFGLANVQHTNVIDKFFLLIHTIFSINDIFLLKALNN